MDAALPTGGERVDERDTMFARMARVPGTVAYAEYYGRRPELQFIDDRLRALPVLLEPGGRTYDAAICAEADAYFARIDTIVPDEAVIGPWVAALLERDDPAATLKAMSVSLGAVAAGCTGVWEGSVYTKKGRFDSDYGRTVEPPGESALVFLVEMDHREMRRAPGAAAIRESARQYYRAAVIARTVEAALRTAGHAAKAHYDAHYDVILPPLAVAAGLGELGRNNILVADRFGSRVRIGAVTTSAALRHDRPVSLGVDHFCSVCRKCAEACPPRALSRGDKERVRGVWKWPTHVERCYGFWRTVGSDCGVCMAVCPFSHRDSALHNLVRRLARRVPAAHSLLVWCDDRLYGRAWTPAGVGRPSPRYRSKNS